MQRAYVYIPPPARRLASSTHAVTLLRGAQSCELVVRNARPPIRRAFQGLDEVCKCDDAHTSQTLGLLDLLHRAERPLATLLTVECQRDTRRLRCGAADEAERFAHRRTRRDHIVDDENAAAHRSADDAAAFAVILCFLAVEGVGHI